MASVEVVDIRLVALRCFKNLDALLLVDDLPPHVRASQSSAAAGRWAAPSYSLEACQVQTWRWISCHLAMKSSDETVKVSLGRF